MKRIFVFIAACACIGACGTASKVKPSDNPENSGVEPGMTRVDTVCYLLGANTGIMINTNDFFENIDEMNVDMLMKGFADAMNAGKPEIMNPYASLQDTVWVQKFQVNPYDMNQILNDYLADRAAEKAELNKKLGEEFLAENARRPEVKVTESGLQYVMHSAGAGEKVGPDDTAVVNYRGTLTDGTEFDSNDGIEISPSRVIPGMAEGLELLAKGGKATLYIPADLAYGENAPRGSVIQPNSVLVFEVEVIDIIRN